MGIWVLRLGHRLHRDERVSTHCGLVARAFSADGIVYSGDRDDSVIDSVKKVMKKWGGPFEIKYEKNWKKVIEKWKGKTVHLTVYGLPIQDKINEIRNCKEDLLVIIGGKKVPAEVYQLADWNISVTQQPHSEIASLCYFLDYFFERKKLNKKFENAKVKIIPSERGKKVVKL